MQEKYLLTDEQNQIINSNNDVIIINAYAGTGKTSTLVEYSKVNSNKRGLYIAFNKDMQIEATKRFPANVECRTLHSLARSSEIVQKYDRKGKITDSNIRVKLLADVLNAGNYTDIKDAILLLEFWFNSALLELNDSILNSDLSIAGLKKTTGSYLEYVLNLANKIKEIMFNIEDARIKLTPSGYLKLYHLSKPSFEHFDFIMHDEAQDSNDVTVDIISKSASRVIIVGDTHQSIYQFRGAKNAMTDFAVKSPGALYKLTHSFRFNQNIADVANTVISKYKNDKSMILGKGTSGEVQIIEQHDLDKIFNEIPRYTVIISRKNASLFNIASKLINLNKKFYFAGGIDRYQFDLFVDVCYLFERKFKLIKDKEIQNFSSYTQFEQYVNQSKESDLRVFTNFIKEHRYQSRELLMEFKRVNDLVQSGELLQKDLDHLLITSHRSKGLEFKKGLIWNDFDKFNKIQKDPKLRNRYECNTMNESERIDYEQEVNLYYVAVTRAKELLMILK